MLSQPGQRRRRRRQTSTAPSRDNGSTTPTDQYSAQPARPSYAQTSYTLPIFANLSSPALNRRSGTPPRPAPRQPRATCPTSTSSASSWRVRPPWPRRGEGPAGARGGETSSSRLRPLGSCDLQDRPPSGSMDTSMRWSPSLSAAPAEARFVDPGPLLPQIALSGERWGPSSRRLPSVGKGDPVRRSLRAIRLPP